jgi:hypothetical protein
LTHMWMVFAEKPFVSGVNVIELGAP